MQRPEFASIVVGMILVMAIPAIFLALVLEPILDQKPATSSTHNKTLVESKLEHQGREDGGDRHDQDHAEPRSRRTQVAA